MPNRTAKDLTALAVKNFKAPESGRVEHFDGRVTGLAIRISPADHRSWVIHYRFAGRSQRYTIGNCANTSLAEARDKAIKVLAKVKDHIDPNAEKKAARLRKPDADLFKSVVELFIERYAKGHQRKSWRETGEFSRHTSRRNGVAAQLQNSPAAT